MTNPRFCGDDSIRPHLPDGTDPDREHYNGCFGDVIEVFEDDARRETGDEQENKVYWVRLEDGEVADFCWRDLHPRIEEDTWIVNIDATCDADDEGGFETFE